MTRVRVVSLRHFDPIIRGLSHRAFRAWALSLEWSCFHGTDGALSPEDVKTVGATPAVTQELLDRGVWKLDEAGELFLAERREGPVFAEVEGCDVEHRALPPAPKKTSAERTRKYRARKGTTSRDSVTERHSDVSLSVTESVTVTGHGDGSSVTGGPTGGPSDLVLLSSLDSESSPATSSDPKDFPGGARDSEKPAKPKKRKTLVPDDWAPKERHIRVANERGLDVTMQAQRFRNRSHAQGEGYIDHDRGFDNWLISPYAKPENGASNGARPTRAGDLTESLLQRAAMLRSQGQ